MKVYIVQMRPQYIHGMVTTLKTCAVSLFFDQKSMELIYVGHVFVKVYRRIYGRKFSFTVTR